MDPSFEPRYSDEMRGDGNARAKPDVGARRKALIAVLVVLGLAVAVFALALLRREPMLTPAFDEARDLDRVPPSGENGWTVIAAAANDFPRDVLGARERDIVNVLLGGTGAPDLAALEAIGTDLDALDPSSDAARAVDEALARPRFVIDCPLDLEGPPCPVLEWLTAHRLAGALALRESRQGWHAEALERAERMLAADRDAVRGARTMFTAVAATGCAREAIELTTLLAASIAADEAPIDAPVRAQLDAVELALVSLEPSRWSLDRAMAGEAIIARRAIDTLDGSDTVGVGGEFGTLFFDRGRTARLLDAYYVAMAAHARDPGTVPAPEPPRGGAFLDPVGTQVLESLSFDLTSLVARHAESATEAEDEIAAARVALAAARAAAARTGTGSPL